jgi:phosphohistidine swiveling domain-containing protein
VDRCGSLVVLQSRPITSAMGQRIFDNANIVENYPGLTLPLTFSFARATYEHTFRAASRAFGVPRKTLEAATPVYANLVALIEGRMYYDVLHWYELYLMVPGFEALVPAWEKALGLPPRDVPITGRSSLATRLRILGRIAYLFLSRGGMVRSFHRRFEAVQRGFRSHDLKSLSADKLFALFEEVFEQLAAPFQITVINDFFAQQSFGVLDKVLRRWSPEEAEKLRNDLLCGISGMASMELLGSLEALAAHVRRRPEWRELLAGTADAREVWRRIHEELPYAELSRRIREHLWRFGNRTVFELKLETPTVDDDPRHFLDNLITLLDKDVDRARPLVDPAARRRAAEACLLERGGPGRLRAALIRRLLRYSRAAMRDRETLRLLRARAYDIVRCIFRRLGERLSEAGALVEAGDVFYLTIEEIETAARPSPPSPEWQDRVAARKDEYARFAAVEPPPRISKGRSRSPTIAAQEFPIVVPEVPEGMTMLRGLGCSAGMARGRARIVADPHRARNASGDIIVARSTDPGWVFLLTTASGLVVERGNVLSHIAIVGRELGLPIVAGIPDATRRSPEGCTIHIDGSSGIVVVGEVPPASERA